MPKNAVIHTRIDAELKAGAEQILDNIGISSSEAIRLFYKQIELHHGIPFDLRIPNKLTVETLRKSQHGEEVHQARDADDLFTQLDI